MDESPSNLTFLKIYVIINYKMKRRKKMKFMSVQCISERKGYNKLIVGNKYLLDRDSIYIDFEGDAFADVYEDENSRKIGMYQLSHFMSV
jgi:hypothetical protein